MSGARFATLAAASSTGFDLFIDAVFFSSTRPLAHLLLATALSATAAAADLD
jgi:hypothetical protein